MNAKEIEKIKLRLLKLSKNIKGIDGFRLLVFERIYGKINLN